MKVNIVTFYEISLAAMAYVVVGWVMLFLSKEYQAPISLTALGVMTIAGVIMTAWLWHNVKPRSFPVKVKVVLYGFLAGWLIGLGLYGWGGWLPPIP